MYDFEVPPRRDQCVLKLRHDGKVGVQIYTHTLTHAPMHFPRSNKVEIGKS